MIRKKNSIKAKIIWLKKGQEDKTSQATVQAVEKSRVFNHMLSTKKLNTILLSYGL